MFDKIRRWVIKIWAGLWQLNHKGFPRLAGTLFLLTWMIGITLLLRPENPDPVLALYIILPLAAGFLLSASFSLVFGVLSIFVYSLFYFLFNVRMPFNFFFVFATILIAFASWAISRQMNIILQELRKSNQKYLELLEHNPTFTYIISGENPGKVIYASPMINVLLGYSPQEWMEVPGLWQNRLHPDDKKWVEEEWEKARLGHEVFHADYRLISQDNRIVWVSDEAVAIHNPGEPVRVQGIMLDITTRKRYESVQAVIYKISQAANSARNLEALFKVIHNGLSSLMHAENFFIALYDPAAQTIEFPYWVDQFDPPPLPQPLSHGLTEYVLRTGQPLFANPDKFNNLVTAGVTERIGSPSLDWLGVPLKMFDRTIGVMAVQSYTEGIRFNEEDLEILTFVSTQVAMAIERKQSDEALSFSEQLYHTATDSLNEMIHVVNRERRLLMQNQSFRNRNIRLGLPVEILGKTIFEAFPFLGPEIIDDYQAVFETGAVVSSIVERRINGEFFIYDTNIVPIIEGGRGERAITVLRDITDQKMAEMKIKSALAEKEILLREIHHRVKNNLQVITSLLGLQAEYLDDPHSLEIFRETQARLRSMALIHEELYQSHDLAQINFHEYIEKLISNLFQAFSTNPNIHLELDIEEVFFGIEAAIPCGLIINELVTNALKYAFPGDRAGTITLSMNLRSESGSSGDYILTLADDGVGIPDPIDFKNTESLGLQLVNILVSQLKGKIQLYRENGSRFVIEFREKQGS